MAIDLALFTQLSDAGDQTAWVSRTVPPILVVGVGLPAMAPLIFRKQAPYAVCLVLAAHAATVTVLLGSRPFVSLLVALYTAAVWLPLRRAVLALSAIVCAHGVAIGYEASFPHISGYAIAAVAAVYLLADVATWAAGRWGAGARARRTTERLHRERIALARAAVSAERLRISHELHDIVAHAVTVMLLQTGGARGLLRSGLDDDRAAAVLEALDAADGTGREAMAELRRLLTVLRAEEVDAGPADRGSSAGLDDLEALVTRTRAAGVAVRLDTTGRPRRLDPSVDLTAYRIVQEGLTNVTKHAGPGTHAEVVMVWGPRELTISVADDGPHRPLGALGSGGFGLVGLGERVGLVGGHLRYGPRPDAPGHRLTAELPLAVTGDPVGPIERIGRLDDPALVEV